MKKIILILFILSSCSTKSDKLKSVLLGSSNTLTGKNDSLELCYIVWGCACANWVTPDDFDKFKDKELDKHCIFIEPVNDSLQLPIYFEPCRHRIKVKGQFYSEPDYPKGTVQTEEHLDKAKVFRYNTLEVIENSSLEYLPEDDQILTLDYNAIECTCAQWSESKFSDLPNKRKYLYLERGNKNIINADTLFNGNNLPIRIKVTGQFVSESGYPTGYNPLKGIPKPGKVFRYSKIKIVDKKA